MKKLLGAGLTIILLALVFWIIQAKKKSSSLPAFVTLPDGSLVRICAVTYGTKHVAGSQVARVIAHLPSPLQDLLFNILGNRVVPIQSVTTAAPELLVWLDQRTNGPPATTYAGYCMAVLGGEDNFISGGEASFVTAAPVSLIYPLHFSAFPRREQKITLNIYEHNYHGVAHLRTNLSFANPLHQTFPQWQAEPLPATKRTGDLEATVQRFETGHNDNISYQSDSPEYGTSDGRNNTAVYLKLRPLTNTNETWQVCGAELSDATGNHLHNQGMSWAGNHNAVFAFNPGLWLGEAAWKIKLEVKKTEGFRPEELFVFRNVPLGELNHTNTIGWTTNVAGMTITLFTICRRAPITNNEVWSSTESSSIHFTLTSPPAGTQLDLVQMVCNNGKTNHCDSWSSSGSERDYTFRDLPLDAQTADITFAIQPSRTVEFTLKPELPKPKPKK